MLTSHFGAKRELYKDKPSHCEETYFALKHMTFADNYLAAGCTFQSNQK